MGAGPWYSVLGGRDPNIRSKSGGIFAKYEADGGASKNIYLADFAIIGDITERDDSAPTNALGGMIWVDLDFFKHILENISNRLFLLSWE